MALQRALVDRSATTSVIGRMTEEVRSFADLAVDGWRVATTSLDGLPPRYQLLIEVGIRHTRLILDQGQAGLSVITQVPTSEPLQIAMAVRDALGRAGPGVAISALGFADDLALDMDVTLPKAPVRVLNETVASRIASDTPFALGEGLAFWSVTRAAGDVASAKIAVVPSHVVMPIIDALDEAGLLPRLAVRSGVSGDWCGEPAWLAPAKPPSATLVSHVRQWPRTARVALAAGLLVVASGVANLAITTWQASAIMPAAQQARDVAMQAGKRDVDGAFLFARQREALTKLQFLNALSERLPSENWFERIEVKDDKVELIGFGASAAVTLSLIAGLPGVVSAELMSAVTRDQTRNIERFRVTARLGRPLSSARAPVTVAKSGAAP